MAPPHFSKAPEALVDWENKLQIADACVQGQQRMTQRMDCRFQISSLIPRFPLSCRAEASGEGGCFPLSKETKTSPDFTNHRNV
jgi:hypothetical protein